MNWLAREDASLTLNARLVSSGRFIGLPSCPIDMEVSLVSTTRLNPLSTGLPRRYPARASGRNQKTTFTRRTNTAFRTNITVALNLPSAFLISPETNFFKDMESPPFLNSPRARGRLRLLRHSISPRFCLSQSPGVSCAVNLRDRVFLKCPSPFR